MSRDLAEPEQGDEVDAWREHTRRARSRVMLALLGLLGVLVGGVAWALGPPKVPEARAGRVLSGDVLVAWSSATRIRAFGLESLHPFDIRKMDRMAAQLVDEGLMGWEDFAVGAEPTREQLLSVHEAALLDGYRDPELLSAAIEVQVPGFLSEQVVDDRVLRPFRLAAGGTVVAARHAARGGLGINLAGGYHHARPDLGHGFCLYNDVALAISELRAEGFDGHVLIVDTDAHQGDGNHAAFADDPSVSTFSMHQRGIFPQPGVAGDVERPLSAGTEDAEFLRVLEETLGELMALHEPALVVHIAGADVLSDDPLASLSLSPDGLSRRDRLVQRFAEGSHAGLLYVLGGGYGPSAAEAQGRSIAEMIRAAQEGGR